MKKPKLSSILHEELKKDTKGDKKRRIISRGLIILAVIVFAVLAKVFIFKGNIKINDQETKSPSQKIENQPQVAKPSTSETPPAAPNSQPAASPAPAPSQPASPGYTTYVVKEGDTLSGIANANGMTSAQLMSYNGLTDPNSIQPGDQLKIPK